MKFDTEFRANRSNCEKKEIKATHSVIKINRVVRLWHFGNNTEKPIDRHFEGDFNFKKIHLYPSSSYTRHNKKQSQWVNCLFQAFFFIFLFACNLLLPCCSCCHTTCPFCHLSWEMARRHDSPCLDSVRSCCQRIHIITFDQMINNGTHTHTACLYRLHQTSFALTILKEKF